MPQISIRQKKDKAVVKIRLNKNEYVDENRIQFPLRDAAFVGPDKVKRNGLVYNLSGIISLKDYIAYSENKFDTLVSVLQVIRPCSLMENYWKTVITDPDYIFMGNDGRARFLCVPVSNFEILFNPKQMVLSLCKEDRFLNSSGLMEVISKYNDLTVDNLIEIISSVSGKFYTKQNTVYEGTTVLDADTPVEQAPSYNSHYEVFSSEPSVNYGTTVLSPEDSLPYAQQSCVPEPLPVETIVMPEAAAAADEEECEKTIAEPSLNYGTTVLTPEDSLPCTRPPHVPGSLPVENIVMPGANQVSDDEDCDVTIAEPSVNYGTTVLSPEDSLPYIQPSYIPEPLPVETIILPEADSKVSDIPEGACGTVLLGREEDKEFFASSSIPDYSDAQNEQKKEQRTFDRIADKFLTETYGQGVNGINPFDVNDDDEHYRDGMTVLLSDIPSLRKVMFVLERESTGEKVPIKDDGLKVGSNARYVDYCLSDNKAVSSYHALFTCNGKCCFVRDNLSTNGTYVNGTKIEAFEEFRLNNGDKISIADELFNFIQID